MTVVDYGTFLESALFVLWILALLVIVVLGGLFLAIWVHKYLHLMGEAEDER